MHTRRVKKSLRIKSLQSVGNTVLSKKSFGTIALGYLLLASPLPSFAESADNASSGSTSLASAREVGRGDFQKPRFSPDNRKILTTGTNMQGLAEIDLQSSKVQALSSEAGIGYAATYRPDGKVAFTSNRTGTPEHLQIDRSGRVQQSTAAEPKAFAHQGAIFMRTPLGIAKISNGDRCFAPSLSADGNQIAYTGLATGIHIYNLQTGTRTHLGAGTAPTWSPNSQQLLFERTEDDGHNILASELFVWSASTGTQQLTNSKNRIERNPAWSSDGAQVAFDDGKGGIFVMDYAANTGGAL